MNRIPHGSNPFLLLFVLLVALLTSCSRGNQEVSASLDRIEQVIGQHPDSALAELVRLDSLLDEGAVHIEGDRQMARYALLKTQTRDKNYIDDTSDSLILRAIRYYDKHGSKREQMLAHFYHGAIFRNAKDYGAAFFAYRQAENLAKELDDDHYLALIFGNLATLGYETYSKDAIRYARKNLEYARRSKDFYEALHAKADMAKIYSSRMQYDSAEILFRQIMDSLPASDPVVQGILTSYVEQSISTGKYSLADSLQGLQHALVLPIDLMNKACLFQMKGMPDSTDVCITLAEQAIKTPGQRVYYYEKLGWISEMRGELSSALELRGKRLREQNKIIMDIYSKTVTDYQRDFERQEREHAEYRYSLYRYRTGLVSFIVVLLILGGTRYFLHRRKEQQLLIDNYIENAFILQQTLLERNNSITSLQRQAIWFKSELKNLERRQKEEKYQDLAIISSEQQRRKQLETENDEMRREAEKMQEREEELQSRIRHLFAQRFKDLDALCIEYFDTQGKYGQRQQIYEKVQQLIMSFSSANAQKELENLIDDTFNDVMRHAHSTELNLTEDELQLYRYKVAGLSSRSIRLLMQINSRDALQKRQQRLKAKILASNHPEKERLVALLH